jgi:hypothetical protein
MFAQDIFALAPLGARIGFSDGIPRPPDRFRKKLSAWENDNGVGRLTAKQPARLMGGYQSAAGFNLHLGDYGSHGVTIIVVTRCLSVTSRLDFEILDVPQPGMVRVLTDYQGAVELRHLASDMVSAQRWAENNRYSDMRFDVVTQAEVSRFTATGRAA